MKSNHVIIRPAATIMLLRECNANGIEVLLLRRNPKLKFAPGFWVFPGGAIELNEIKSTESILEAARVAASRETMEETGVSVDPSALHFYVHWTTPQGGQRRFATWFFYTWIDNEAIQIDNSEIIDYKWLGLSTALDVVGTDQIPILPPTYVSLQRISKCSTKTEIDTVLQSGTPIVMPKTKFVDQTFYSFYKGDAAYHTLNETEPGPRHRIIGNLKKGLYNFEYEGCDHIMPVTGHID